MYRKFTPILDALRVPLESQLKRKVDIHLTIFKDYETGIKALASGKIDFVRFGPSSYILAEQKNKDIQLLAMELRNGLKRFNGFIITKSDSCITKISDLKGRSFAFGDKNSTIGRFLAQSLLVNEGINSKNLSKYDYLGRHDLVAKAVITGTHDAGAIKASTYKKLCDPDEIIIVEAFENVTKPWVAKSELPKEICDAITAALIGMEITDDIGELGCSGFIDTNSKEYDQVRNAMEHSKKFAPTKPSTPIDKE